MSDSVRIFIRIPVRIEPTGRHGVEAAGFAIGESDFRSSFVYRQTMRDDSVRETVWLRGLIIQVAEGLERLAAAHEADRVKLEQAAMWLRRQLHRGPPPAGPSPGMGVGQGPATSETSPTNFSEPVESARGRTSPPKSG